jgi:ABC-type glycerol-3-phosphate transport system substrate-binding protein
MLMSLDSLMTDAKKAQLDPTYQKTVILKGHTWGIDVDNSLPDALVLNRKMFVDAGAADLLPKEPDRDWTTDDFEKACASVTKAPNVYCTLLWAKVPSYDHATGIAWLTAWGCQMFNPGDYSKVTINSPQCVSGMQWLKSIIDKGYVVPGPAGLTDDDLDNYLLTGKIALAGGGWYELGLVQSGKKDGSLKVDFDPYMVNYPHLAGQKPGQLANLGGRVIVGFQSKTSDAARDAAILKFIDYYTQPDMMTKMVQKDAGGLAGTPLLANVDVTKLFPGNTDFAWILGLQNQRGTTDYGWTANNFVQLRQEWANARQAIWSGDTTVEQGLSDFEKKADALLTSTQ